MGGLSRELQSRFKGITFTDRTTGAGNTFRAGDRFQDPRDRLGNGHPECYRGDLFCLCLLDALYPVAVDYAAVQGIQEKFQLRTSSGCSADIAYRFVYERDDYL